MSDSSDEKPPSEITKKGKPRRNPGPKRTRLPVELRKEIANLYQSGASLQQLSVVSGYSEKVIRREMGTALSIARIKRNAAFQNRAMQIALGQLDGFPPKLQVSMLQFVLKTQCGWSEKNLDPESQGTEDSQPIVIFKASSVTELQNLGINTSVMEMLFNHTGSEGEE